MDPLTHVAMGVLLSQLLPSPSPVWSAVAGISFALLPDCDYFLIFSHRLAFIRHHRAFSHSLMALPLFSLLAAGVAWVLGGPRWFQPIFFLGLAVLASHLLVLDLPTSYGTQLLFPFSPNRFALDWLFIIDPYLTALLLAGAVAAPIPGWGHRAGLAFLATAGGYLLLCGCYHRQALALARQVFHSAANPGPLSAPSHPGQAGSLAAEGLRVAALPQPYSCRRWLLLASNGREVAQALVQLPYLAPLGFWRAPEPPAVTRLPLNCRAPAEVYPAPQDLRLQVFSGLPMPELDLDPEAREIRDRYLEFARFPLLQRAQALEGGLALEWLDLRFSVPGRVFPFALRMRLDPQGRVRQWRLGPCGQGVNTA
ncbi:MAG: metal-dependent hydrolase [Desulfobaccales bacterium]|jgi:inner membrane protein